MPWEQYQQSITLPLASSNRQKKKLTWIMHRIFTGCYNFKCWTQPQLEMSSSCYNSPIYNTTCILYNISFENILFFKTENMLLLQAMYWTLTSVYLEFWKLTLVSIQVIGLTISTLWFIARMHKSNFTKFILNNVVNFIHVSLV